MKYAAAELARKLPPPGAVGKDVLHTAEQITTGIGKAAKHIPVGEVVHTAGAVVKGAGDVVKHIPTKEIVEIAGEIAKHAGELAAVATQVANGAVEVGKEVLPVVLEVASAVLKK